MNEPTGKLIPRGDMRPPAATEAKAEEDPRARAARRAAEISDHRNGNLDDGTDEFFVEPGVIPDGWAYEWKTRTILGKEDPAHQVKLARDGWEVVPASRHPEMMPHGYTGNEITRKGMVLMEIPVETLNQYRQINDKRARQQVRHKEEQLSAARPGEFERSNKGNDLVKVKKGYEAMQIPE